MCTQAFFPTCNSTQHESNTDSTVPQQGCTFVRKLVLQRALPHSESHSSVISQATRKPAFSSLETEAGTDAETDCMVWNWAWIWGSQFQTSGHKLKPWRNFHISDSAWFTGLGSSTNNAHFLDHACSPVVNARNFAPLLSLMSGQHVTFWKTWECQTLCRMIS